jgi:5-methylcytosine-specific restriction endonuclease McrA
MFAYCVGRLGLSEDEACRRIDVARLARQYPEIYPRLAAGQLSLSVTVLLKQYLSASTAAELLDLVAGSTIEKAKELLASRFPRPDVASVIRKLPERSAPRAAPRDDSPMSSGAVLPEGSAVPAPAMQLSSARVSAQPGCSSEPSASARAIVEPLSKARYKIQLTADKELKEKLELARDLMRHIQPDGDLAPILSRALDLLIEQIMKRRFGARATRSALARVNEPAAGGSASTPLNSDPEPAAATEDQGTPPPSISTASAPTASVLTASTQTASSLTEQQPVVIPRATRRNVVERDGLCCTWQGPDGTRCNARAWLELDHRHPRARGGNATPENIRVLCRAHNQRAAEHEYGRRHIEDRITRARSREHAEARDTAIETQD